MRKLALFDLDGTITEKDTFLEFIRFCHGNTIFYLGFLALLPAVVLFKLGLMNNTRMKVLTLRLFFKGRSTTWMKRHGEQFCEQEMPRLVKPDMLQLLDQLKAEGADIYIVTASLGTWTEPWCQQQGYKIISSAGCFYSDMFDGTLEGPNCHGEEKVNRIKAQIRLEDYDHIVGYGDSPSDKPMLALCTEAHYLGK